MLRLQNVILLNISFLFLFHPTVSIYIKGYTGHIIEFDLMENLVEQCNVTRIELRDPLQLIRYKYPDWISLNGSDITILTMSPINNYLLAIFLDDDQNSARVCSTLELNIEVKDSLHSLREILQNAHYNHWRSFENCQLADELFIKVVYNREANFSFSEKEKINLSYEKNLMRKGYELSKYYGFDIKFLQIVPEDSPYAYYNQLEHLTVHKSIGKRHTNHTIIFSWFISCKSLHNVKRRSADLDHPSMGACYLLSGYLHYKQVVFFGSITALVGIGTPVETVINPVLRKTTETISSSSYVTNYILETNVSRFLHSKAVQSSYANINFTSVSKLYYSSEFILASVTVLGTMSTNKGSLFIFGSKTNTHRCNTLFNSYSTKDYSTVMTLYPNNSDRSSIFSLIQPTAVKSHDQLFTHSTIFIFYNKSHGQSNTHSKIHTSYSKFIVNTTLSALNPCPVRITCTRISLPKTILLLRTTQNKVSSNIFSTSYLKSSYSEGSILTIFANRTIQKTSSSNNLYFPMTSYDKPLQKTLINNTLNRFSQTYVSPIVSSQSSFIKNNQNKSIRHKNSHTHHKTSVKYKKASMKIAKSSITISKYNFSAALTSKINPTKPLSLATIVVKSTKKTSYLKSTNETSIGNSLSFIIEPSFTLSPSWSLSTKMVQNASTAVYSVKSSINETASEPAKSSEFLSFSANQVSNDSSNLLVITSAKSSINKTATNSSEIFLVTSKSHETKRTKKFQISFTKHFHLNTESLTNNILKPSSHLMNKSPGVNASVNQHASVNQYASYTPFQLSNLSIQASQTRTIFLKTFLHTKSFINIGNYSSHLLITTHTRDSISKSALSTHLNEVEPSNKIFSQSSINDRTSFFSQYNTLSSTFKSLKIINTLNSEATRVAETSSQGKSSYKNFNKTVILDTISSNFTLFGTASRTESLNENTYTYQNVISSAIDSISTNDMNTYTGTLRKLKTYTKISHSLGKSLTAQFIENSMYFDNKSTFAITRGITTIHSNEIEGISRLTVIGSTLKSLIVSSHIQNKTSISQTSIKRTKNIHSVSLLSSTSLSPTPWAVYSTSQFTKIPYHTKNIKERSRNDIFASNITSAQTEIIPSIRTTIKTVSNLAAVSPFSQAHMSQSFTQTQLLLSSLKKRNTDFSAELRTFDSSSLRTNKLMHSTLISTYISLNLEISSYLFSSVIMPSAEFTTARVPTDSIEVVKSSTSSVRNSTQTPPKLLRPIGHIFAKTGEYFSYKIKNDMFIDISDGDARNLSLECTTSTGLSLESNAWLSFHKDSLFFEGLPLSIDYDNQANGGLTLRLIAYDSDRYFAVDFFQVSISERTKYTAFTISMTLSIDYSTFIGDKDFRIELYKRISNYFNDSQPFISFTSVSNGSTIVEWTNTTITSTCNRYILINSLFDIVRIAHTNSPPISFSNFLLPEFPLLGVTTKLGICPPTPAPYESANFWLYVIPIMVLSVILIAVLLILFVVCRRRKKRDHYMKKGREFMESQPPMLSDVLELKQKSRARYRDYYDDYIKSIERKDFRLSKDEGVLPEDMNIVQLKKMSRVIEEAVEPKLIEDVDMMPDMESSFIGPYDQENDEEESESDSDSMECSTEHPFIPVYSPPTYVLPPPYRTFSEC